MSNWQTVQNPAGGLVAADTGIHVHSDVGQPYDDLAGLRYGASQGCIFFQFNLRGKIPYLNESVPVQAIWYQVLIAVGQSSATGYEWSNTFTPEYMLDLEIAYLPGNQPEFSVMRYSGTGADWSWTPLSGTEQIGANATLQGGIGQDFFVIACRYLDLGAAGQSTLGFFARSGIRMNNGGQYNDYVPSSGILSMTLPQITTASTSVASIETVLETSQTSTLSSSQSLQPSQTLTTGIVQTVSQKPIPGFSIDSIVLGVMVGFVLLIIARRASFKRKSTS